MRVLRAVCGALVVGLGAVALATPATASVIYSYVGNPYVSIDDAEVPAGTYTSSMFITARIELPDVPDDLSGGDLTDSILSYEVSDGRVTLNESNSTISFSDLYISDGRIDSWALSVWTEPNGVGSQVAQIVSFRFVSLDAAVLAVCLTDACATEAEFSFDKGQAPFSPRPVWTLVPEPGTHALLALAIAGLAMRRARTKRQPPPIGERSAHD